MKINKLLHFYMVFAIAIGTICAFFSCDNEDDNSIKQYLFASPQKLIFDYEGRGEIHDGFNIDSNEEWTIYNQSDWISLDKTSGKSNEFISVEVNENSGKNERTATISITSKSGIENTVTVIQEAYTQPYQPEISPDPEEKLLGRWDVFFIDDGWDEKYSIYLDMTFEKKDGKYGTSYTYLAKVYYDLDNDGMFSDYKGDIDGLYYIREYSNKFEIISQYSTLPSGYALVVRGAYDIKELTENTFIFNNLNITYSGRKK